MAPKDVISARSLFVIGGFLVSGIAAVVAVILVLGRGSGDNGNDALNQLPSLTNTTTNGPTPTPGGDTPLPTQTPVPGRAVIMDVGKLAEGDDNNLTFTGDELVSPRSDVTYLITIDNDSNAPVTISSLTDDVYAGVACRTAGGANVIGSVVAADDGDAKFGPGHFDGGADEIQCEFVEPAPANHGVKVTDTVTAEVQDDTGQTGTNTATSTITTN